MAIRKTKTQSRWTVRQRLEDAGKAHSKALSRLNDLRKQLAQAEAEELTAHRAMGKVAQEAGEVYPEEFSGLAEHYRINAR